MGKLTGSLAGKGAESIKGVGELTQAFSSCTEIHLKVNS